MKFWVKLLSLFLILATLSTVLASCLPQSTSTPNVQGGTNNDGIVVIPPSQQGGENNGNNGNGDYVGVIENITAPYIADVHVSASVTPDENNKVPFGGINLDNVLASAIIPGGVQMELGATELALTINGLDESKADITLADTEISSSFDVHVDGVAKDNSVPMEVTLAAAAAKGLNSTSIKLYHVENGETVEMTLIGADEPFTAHNQFKYNPATGDVTLYIASFSEFAIVANTENAWTGEADHSWYDAKATELVIANAEQLWSFSQIVGGMAEGIDQDSFFGKTVKLIADINLGDAEAKNNEDIIFYPIGYWNNEGTYERKPSEERTEAVSSGFYNFCGTFDGNGHTIANFYQNTWEMKGDHNWYDPIKEQYYRDGMGLFGKVYGGTVKNLTVSNFSSDGEIATTGVIAAYADCGATFENIAIFNCNPRVYNIGNGGIVGCVGWYTKEVTDKKVTFNNITVDNSNKISALWGSYDVACGGIVGQYYPTSGQSSAEYPVNAGIEFTNCHVSAVMDVYNDVCANYQYYAYRYTGMFIGSVRENVTGEDGRVYPDMTGITAKYCTVHFGTWNDYYYCELIDNTTASYTHDYQMSRLTQVENVDVENKKYIPLGETEWIDIPTTGMVNFVVVDGEHATENATCYHFKNGKVYKHEDQGLQDGIDENGDGQIDLKEDKQHIYLEFNNLFTGYGWGVTSYGLTNLDGINNMDIIFAEGNPESSVEKFGSTDKLEFETGTAPSISEIFKYLENCGVEIKNDQVIVTVSPATGSTADAIWITADSWENSTLSLSGVGALNVTISDYYYCVSTTVTITVTPTDKFEYKYGEKHVDGTPNENFKDFLLRIGNQNELAIGLLLNSIAPTNVTIDPNTLGVQVFDLNGNALNYEFKANKNNWELSTLKINDYTGIAVIRIKDETSNPYDVMVEVVSAINATSATSATSGNIVLLADADLSSMAVSGRYTFYGNGFTLTYSGNGQYLNNGLKQGVVTVSENGTLDNVRIKAPVYPKAYMYYGYSVLGNYVQEGPKSEETTNGTTKTRYHYQLSAVVLKGNATISNSYIYGGRNNVFVDTGDVTIKDTILECGTVANIQIESNSSHTITFENLTTIQYLVDSAAFSETPSVKNIGAGILVGPEATSNPKLVLNGNLKQYNWVNEDDKTAISNEAGKQIIKGALEATQFNHTINGKNSSNLGIIFMNTSAIAVENNTGLPYVQGSVSISSANGTAYSLSGASANQIYSDYANADRTTVNGAYVPQFKYDSTLGGQYEAKTDDGDTFLYRDGDTIYVMFPSGDSKTINLTTLINLSKYTGQEMSAVITCKDSKGNTVAISDGNVTLSAADTYTVTYTFTDTMVYDKDGNDTDKSIVYSWNVTLNVSLKDNAVPNASFKFDTSKQKMGYYVKSGMFSTSVYQYIPFLAGLQIYDYNGQTEYLRFDGDKDYNKVASIVVTNKYSGNDARIVVTLTDGGVIDLQLLARADSGGGSTYTGSIKTSNNTIYFVNDGTTSESDKTTTAAYWYVDYYKFTGNNGVAIQAGTQTFNSTGESKSTPSGSFSTKVNYTVTYNANSGNCGQTTGYATSASTAVTLPTPSRSGYIFAGWYTAASGGTRVGGAGESYTPSANITLYAQWGKPCTVTYNANGGSCGTASEKYTGTALTLPTPTRDGYWFVGWYDAAEGGNKIGDADAKYNPTNEITLYAHWQQKIEYTVTYNANGGSCGTASATYQGTTLTLPTPTRTGYTFNGWYTAASGGTKVGDAGATYTPSANITLYAQWEALPTYTITINKQSNATVTVDKSSTYEGDTVSVTVSFSQSNNRTLTVKDESGNTILSKSAAGTYTFEMPASNVTIEASSEKACVTSDTLVMLADGTQKRIDQVTFADKLLVWDFVNGEYTIASASIIENHGYGYENVITLIFEDGTTVKVVNVHGFFDADLNKWVDIDAENANDFIGHSFTQVNGDSYKTVKLVSATVSTEYVEAWSILTADQYNCILEGMFTVTPPATLQLAFFEIGEGMKYDAESMQSDIEKYGLYTYEEFAHLLTEEEFEALNMAEMKVAVGKGLITYDEILWLIATYIH